MADKSKIEWTDATWNPLVGCSKISAGCKNCYAETFTNRFKGIPGHHFENGFDLTLKPNKLDQPIRWKKPRMIFVNSLSDLFHKDVPLEYIHQVFDVMNQCTQHTFQLLTKRADRMAALMPDILKKLELDSLPANIWIGVSIENSDVLHRIEHLVQVPALVRWLSMEPLLGPVPDIPHLDQLHWVVVGGESGRKARPMNDDWAQDIRDQCLNAEVPFFFKQWGEWLPWKQLMRKVDDSALANIELTRIHDKLFLRPGKKKAGRLLDGRTWDQMPEIK